MASKSSSPKRQYRQFDTPGASPGSQSLPTGIRVDTCGANYITINGITANGATTAYVYRGSVHGTGKWYPLSFPSGIGRTVTKTMLYGPDIIESDYIQAVGNYNTTEAQAPIGALYQGKLDGSGQWTTLIPFGTATNTIAHSVDRNLVVGNYTPFQQSIQSTQSVGTVKKSVSSPAVELARGFIYHIQTKQYVDITIPEAISTTAYGIWYNGDGTYTICGGYSKLNAEGLDIGYVVDYDPHTNKFKHWQSYYYQNNPANPVAHFDGISPDCAGGYSLTGVALVTTPDGPVSTGFVAHITRKCDGSFSSKAKWEPLMVPEAVTTTGNSIAYDTAIGVYKTSTVPGSTTHGFISWFTC